MNGHERYINKVNRDKRAKELKQQGFIVKRTSSGPSRLHPEYIKDWTQPYQTGFGNTDYLTMHKKLYNVEWKTNE